MLITKGEGKGSHGVIVPEQNRRGLAAVRLVDDSTRSAGTFLWKRPTSFVDSSAPLTQEASRVPPSSPGTPQTTRSERTRTLLWTWDDSSDRRWAWCYMYHNGSRTKDCDRCGRGGFTESSPARGTVDAASPTASDNPGAARRTVDAASPTASDSPSAARRALAADGLAMGFSTRKSLSLGSVKGSHQL